MHVKLCSTNDQVESQKSQRFLGFKMTILFLFVLLMQVSAKSFSQNVTLSLEKEKIQLQIDATTIYIPVWT